LQAGWSDTNLYDDLIERVKEGFSAQVEKGDQLVEIQGAIDNDYVYGYIRIILYP